MTNFITNYFLSFKTIEPTSIEEPIYAWATLLVLVLTLIVAFFTFWTAWQISLKQQEKENDLNVRNSYQIVIKLLEEIEKKDSNIKLLKKQLSKYSWIYDHDLRVATEKWKNGPINDQLWQEIIAITKNRIEEGKKGEKLPLDIEFYQNYVDKVFDFYQKSTLEVFKEISIMFPKILVEDKIIREKTMEIIEDNFIMYLAKSVDKI